MQEVSFEETVEQLMARDPRFQREAYLFVRDALDHTQKQVAKQGKGVLRHVTGAELLEGIRAYGLQQFGPMTMTVFAEWGVRSTADFGEIVFNMVDIGLLAKTDRDSRADFARVYDFEEVFRKPFLPRCKARVAKREVRSAGA